jgi:integrase
MSFELEFSGPFKDVIPLFIQYKRSMGHEFGRTSVYRLREIDLFFADHGVTTVSVPEDIYSFWANLRVGEKPTNRMKRIRALNNLSNFLKYIGYDDIYVGDCPDIRSNQVFIPYIFSYDEITRLFDILTTWCKAKQKRKTVTFAMMIALYYGCALRKSEAQNLKIGDVDLDDGIITIIDSKNHISRNVFLSDSLHRQLKKYYNMFCTGLDDNAYFFLSPCGKYYSDGVLYYNYHRLLKAAGIPKRHDGHFPRIHDLRHTSCVRTLEMMVKKGYDLYTSLSLLSVHLGHKKVTETEYYLRLIEDHFTHIIKMSSDYTSNLIPNIGPKDDK